MMDKDLADFANLVMENHDRETLEYRLAAYAKDHLSAPVLTEGERLPQLRWNYERMKSRVDACIERDGSEDKATTGVGVGISYGFAKELARNLKDAADLIDRLSLTDARVGDRRNGREARSVGPMGYKYYALNNVTSRDRRVATPPQDSGAKS